MAITPYLYYENVDDAVQFLTKAFGFRRFGPRVRDEAGRTNHTAMKLGASVFMLGCPPAGYRNPKRLGQATQCLVINVSNVDTHFERATRAGATVVDPPADTPFGGRRYGVADPEGHQWYFAQRIRKARRRKK